jgi:hypothetical protein
VPGAPSPDSRQHLPHVPTAEAYKPKRCVTRVGICIGMMSAESIV